MRLKLLPRINGRRGAFQLLFGTAFLMLAIAYFIAIDFPPAIAWIHAYLPTPGPLGFIWLIPAIAGLAGAFLPRPKDWFSFAALVFAPSVWGCFYIIGGLMQPHGTSILGAILYWAIAASLMVVSGMTGDRDRDHREVTL
jgi:hypothetical protein